MATSRRTRGLAVPPGPDDLAPLTALAAMLGALGRFRVAGRVFPGRRPNDDHDVGGQQGVSLRGIAYVAYLVVPAARWAGPVGRADFTVRVVGHPAWGSDAAACAGVQFLRSGATAVRERWRLLRLLSPVAPRGESLAGLLLLWVGRRRRHPTR